MSTKHTPLPWSVGRKKSSAGKRSGNLVFAPDGRVIEDTKDNAEFIVRACNSHDDLLAACKKLLAHRSCGAQFDDDECREARTAIAAAEGE